MSMTTLLQREYSTYDVPGTAIRNNSGMFFKLEVYYQILYTYHKRVLAILFTVWGFYGSVLFNEFVSEPHLTLEIVSIV